MDLGRMVRGRQFWLAVLLAAAGIGLGAPWTEVMGKTPLPCGTFLEMANKSFASRSVLFLFPAVSVLPWGDAYLQEKQWNYLRFLVSRRGRRAYCRDRILTSALAGPLVWLAALTAGVLLFFLLFFAREEVFRWPAETVRQFLAVGGRAALIASALSSGAGFCAAVSGSVYLAMGAPFLTFSLLMIFRERYLEKLYCMDPSCWLLGQGYWGEDQRGNLSCTGVPKQKPGSEDLQPGGDSGSGFGNGDAEKYLFLFRDCGAPGDH